ncbi:hypothetical protein BBW65_01355 [Helicobacter enhydrae]|uniref:Uncharacterized protein n=1 Tax=Helicobacter enhydrae TaxID=222136 RepID=A0A1B1U455_9HELI|nr:hypothetical protein [Helicobacter enhydrae]ANV97536.1 hypothetical protein BBW65_01355 [Helicobacter enhydrae]
MFSYQHRIINASLRTLLKLHAQEMIQKLEQEKIPFSIACDISKITFDPPLNHDALELLGAINIFVLSGYSLETLELSAQFFQFRAGVTQDTDVSIAVPYDAVVQIIFQPEDSANGIILFSNPVETLMYGQVDEIDEDEGFTDSLNAILSKNQELMRG